MPKGSSELTNERKHEIMSACYELYKTHNFKDITIKDISKKANMTRTLVYHYYSTKEEIFLDLFAEEYDAWSEELYKILDTDMLKTEQFADLTAMSLEKRTVLLKLLSMNMYDMEENSSIEHLTRFKRSYKRASDTLCECMRKFFGMSDKQTSDFLYTFLPFMNGIYPYSFLTEKQIKAMTSAGIKLQDKSIYELTRSFILKILK